MGWSEAFRFRQCGWCGVRDVTMMKHTNHIEVTKGAGGQRFWLLSTCPRCGGATTIETTGSSVASHRILTVLPKAEADADIDVSHLPEDVQYYFRDSVRAMQADPRTHT